MKIASRLLVISIMHIALGGAAHATEYLSTGAGWFNVNRSFDNSAEFIAEWRGNPFYQGLLPVIGGMANADGGAYGFVGLNYDFPITPQWILTPSFAIGAWHRGDSSHLGGTVELREGLELDYQFSNEYRIGTRFSHISNASMYDHNPGAESVVAIISIPIGK